MNVNKWKNVRVFGKEFLKMFLYICKAIEILLERFVDKSYELTMKRVPILLFILLVFTGNLKASLPPGSEELIFSKTYTINIGINNYSSGTGFLDLQGCINDATLLNSIFGTDSTGWKKLLLDSAASLDSIFKAFTYVMRNCSEDDNFIFTFSGHGDYHQDKFSLILPGYKKEDSLSKEKNEIRSELLKTWLSKIIAKRKIILLDNSNSPEAVYKFIGDIIADDQQMNDFHRSTAIFSVASHEFEMTDGEKVYGQLTYYFKQGLEGLADLNKDGQITCNELNSYIINESYNSGNKITPVYTNSGEDFNVRYFPEMQRQPSKNLITLRIEGNKDIFNENIIDQNLSVEGSLEINRTLFDSIFLSDSVLINPVKQVDLKLSIGDKEMVFDVYDTRNDENKTILSFKSIKFQNKKISRGAGSIEYTNDMVKRNGKDYGLLIGNENFDNWKRLYNPIFDVESIGNELIKNFNFSVQTRKDLTKIQFLLLLKEYSKMIYDDDDQLFIYIASHGDFKEGIIKEGFLVFKDSKSTEEDEFNQTCLSHSDLLNYVNNIPCKHIFLVVDACYAGALDICNSSIRSENEYKDKDKDQFIRDKLEHKARIFLASSRKTEVSDGTKGQHSPFAFRVIETLRMKGGALGIVTIGDIKGNIDKAQGEPVLCNMPNNDPGSDFLFITRE